MANELRSPVVLDATVLSNLAVTDDLELLCALPTCFVTVEAVTDELRAGVEAGCGLTRTFGNLSLPVSADAAGT
jgi:predicted nucleic acid-binding protein